ncbi:hypothetical protein CRE_30505 [Caenorhabditis remanei]|uniref:F-box domain-containing protein n=1 Tax=Caenorhabditis remanei TaxID=31234 RepID=E3NI79_CAERE|nr:hypothetical protein CRE_30505 [Caenorhabditis remanei]
MEPLKQLPILRLPFRAKEEVSKGMHSIMKKMISSRRDNKFPILRLPFLAIEEIFKTMHPIEIINFSMISKRTRTVAKLIRFYTKYSIDLYIHNAPEIRLDGRKDVVSYVMTSDKKMNGKCEEKEQNGCIERKVYNYSKDPVKKLKQLSTHVLDIFKKQTINYLSMQMDAFVDQNVSIIDFLKTNEISVNDCYLYQWEQNNVDENVAYLLNTITIRYNLETWLHIKTYFFDGKIPKNLEGLYFMNSEWIGFEKLLEIYCKSVILGRNWISVEEWNSFFKKWIAMETNQNLECLQLSHKHLETFRALVLHDIPHEVVGEGVKRILKTVRNRSTEINGGIDIRRIDGKTATFFVYREFWTESLAMSIH